MNSVRPLAFLLVRSVVNGVKRAVTSPKRLIGLTFFAFYYWSLFLRRLDSTGSAPNLVGVPRFGFPPTGVIDAVVFGVVGVMSILLMSSVLGYKGGFKTSDVDVLFPTPVSPKVVLVFRIVRDTLATLLLPLFLGIFGYRSASQSFAPFFRDYPKQGGDILRAGVFAYLLVSLVWVCVGYAASLFVNRSDLDSDRNRRRINRAIAVLVVGLAVYIALRLRADLSVATLLSLAHSPGIRIVLAPVTLATWVVMGSFQGDYAFALAGFAGLFGIVALSLRVAMTQVGWMYDQAAVRGFESGPNLRDLQRKGDMMGIQAARARQGKLKHGRIAARIAKIRVRGPMALLWKEAILQARGSLSSLLLIGTVFLFSTGLMMVALTSKHTHGRGAQDLAGWAILGLQGLNVYVLCMASAQSGFIEFLRRVDVQKPLPFTPAATVFWEVAAKAIAPTILGLCCAIVGVAIAPAIWPNALAGTLVTPSLAILLTAVVLLVTVLFPDVDDPTQRAFRGLMLLLGIAICCVPGAAVLIASVALAGVSPLLAAPVVVAINLAIALGLSSLAGNLYASYNPSE